VRLKKIALIVILLLLTGCAPKTPAEPTPDMAALATQLWVEMPVQQMLIAMVPTATPEPTA